MNFSTTLRLSPRIQQEARALANAQARFSLATSNAVAKFSYGEFSRMNNIFGEETAIDYARLNGISTTQIELWLRKGLQ